MIRKLVEILNINKINKIILDGNIFSNTELEFFPVNKDTICRISNIYGRNGSGKTTISKALKGEKLDSVKIKFLDSENKEISYENKDNLYVYNEDFIDSNIKTAETGIKTVIMLGKQKELDDKIDILKTERDELKKEEQKIREDLKKQNDSKNIISPLYYKYDIVNELRKGWATRDRDIKNNTRNSSVIFDTLINSVIENKNDFDISKLREKYNELIDVYTKSNRDIMKVNNVLKEITDFSKNYKNLSELLRKKIAIPEFTNREKEILERVEKGQQKFYEGVREEFKKKEVNICPYCFQDVEKIKKEIILDINKVLSRDVDEHKIELENLKQQFVFISEMDKAYKEIDEKLFLELENVCMNINKEISSIHEEIEKKINNVYIPIDFKNNIVIDLEKKYNDLVSKLESKRNELNESKKRRITIKNQLDTLNLQIAWCEIEDDFKLYEATNLKYENNKKLLEENINKKDQIQKEIYNLESEKKNVKIANDKINTFLEYIFMSKDRLKIEYDNVKKLYLVKSHQKDIRPIDLSTGERNIIALCYFFVKIMENSNEEDIFKEEILVVLDDPISSFDIENKVGLYTFLRMMFSKIIENNENSKIINFTHNLEVIINIEKVCSDICISNKFTYKLWELKNGNFIQFSYKNRNDYKKMIEDIYKYAKSNKDDVDSLLDDAIGNIMRKTIEAYSTFNFNKGIDEITRNKYIIEKIEDIDKKQYFENFMYRLVLNNESHKNLQTRNLDFYDFISSDEKIKTAKSLLLLLDTLDETHLGSYIDDKTYIEDLRKWEKEIIPNK